MREDDISSDEENLLADDYVDSVDKSSAATMTVSRNPSKQGGHGHGLA